MDKNKPTLPFILQYEEAERNITDAVNRAVKINGVPFYLVDGILTNILHQVRLNAEKERTEAMQAYKKQTEAKEES